MTEFKYSTTHAHTRTWHNNNVYHICSCTPRHTLLHSCLLSYSPHTHRYTSKPPHCHYTPTLSPHIHPHTRIYPPIPQLVVIITRHQTAQIDRTGPEPSGSNPLDLTAAKATVTCCRSHEGIKQKRKKT